VNILKTKFRRNPFSYFGDKHADGQRDTTFQLYIVKRMLNRE